MRFSVWNVVYAPNSGFIRHKRQFNAHFGSFGNIAPEICMRRFDCRSNLHDACILPQNRERSHVLVSFSHEKIVRFG
jgi:hypothetical protein